MTTTAQGRDYSAYQPPLTEAELKGLSFAFTKATDGAAATDKNFSENWRTIAAAGRHRGAYHELWSAGSASTAAQVAHFTGVVKAGGLRPGDMLAVVTSDYPGVTDAEVKAFCDGVRAAVGPHNPILPYTDLSVGQTLVRTSEAYPDLWIAWPSPSAPAASQWAPAKWETWRFWQWGETAGVDADAYNGTASDLDNWIATFTGTPQRQEADMTPAVVSTANGTHLFCVGTDHAVWHKPPGGSWASIGGKSLSGVSAAADQSGTITVAVEGSDQRVWSNTLPAGSGTWNGWQPEGGRVG